MAGAKSRWVRGNIRYPKDVEQVIYSKYREQPGWWRGARVSKPKERSEG